MKTEGEIALAINRGWKLNFEDFKQAVLIDMLKTTRKPKTDVEFAKAYLYFIGQYYEDPKRQGYLCGETPTAKTEEGIRDGHKYETFCIWGIHMDEVDPECLTPENWRFLRHKFGRATVAKILGK